MKTLTKTALAATLIAGSVGLTTMVSAMPFGDGPGCGRGGQHMGSGQRVGDRGPNLERLAYRLNMTEEQRAEAKAILDDSRQQMVELRDRMRANRDQIRDLTLQPDFDEAAVRSVADEQGDLKAEMIVLRARQRSEMKAVLTEEQRARLNEMRKEKRQRGRGNRF